MRSCRVRNLNKNDRPMEQFCAVADALAVLPESVEDVMEVPLKALSLLQKTGVNGAFAPSRL